MAKRKINVLHVLTDQNVGGAGRWLLNYLQHCDRERFSVKVVLPKHSELVPMVQALHIPVIGLAEVKDLSYDKGAKAALKAVFKTEQPDVVHTHASLTARMVAKQLGIPLIVNTKHCMEGSAGSLVKKAMRRVLNAYFSHKIIAVSHAVKESMVAGGVKAEQIEVIYNSITPLQSISKKERAELLLAYGGNPEKKAVGIVARLEEVKDHETFLQAVKLVLEQTEQMQFYIIGDGSLRETLQARANALGIASDVKFTGFLKDVERMEACLDLAVITSKSEALCISILETMSLGIPAVGTDSGGIREVILDGQNGYLEAVGDANALAKRMIEIFGEPYAQMSLAAKELVAEKFRAEVMTKQIEALYLEGKL